MNQTTRRHIPQGCTAVTTSDSSCVASAQYVVNVESIGVSIVLQCVVVVTVALSVYWLRIERPRFDSLQGQEFFSSSPRPSRSWGPASLTSSGYHWVVTVTAQLRVVPRLRMRSINPFPHLRLLGVVIKHGGNFISVKSFWYVVRQACWLISAFGCCFYV